MAQLHVQDTLKSWIPLRDHLGNVKTSSSESSVNSCWPIGGQMCRGLIDLEV